MNHEEEYPFVYLYQIRREICEVDLPEGIQQQILNAKSILSELNRHAVPSGSICQFNF